MYKSALGRSWPITEIGATDIRFTAPLTKVQLCEHKNQILEAFGAANRLYAEFEWPVARQNCSLLA